MDRSRLVSMKCSKWAATGEITEDFCRNIPCFGPTQRIDSIVDIRCQFLILERLWEFWVSIGLNKVASYRMTLQIKEINDALDILIFGNSGYRERFR